MYEEVDVSEMMVCNSAMMQSFIGKVSPVKHSWTKRDVRLIEGEVSDRKKMVWMVSFETKVKARVEKAWESG